MLLRASHDGAAPESLRRLCEAARPRRASARGGAKNSSNPFFARSRRAAAARAPEPPRWRRAAAAKALEAAAPRGGAAGLGRRTCARSGSPAAAAAPRGLRGRSAPWLASRRSQVPVQKRETMVANYYATDEGKTTKTAAKPAPDGDRRGRRALVGLALVAALALASCRHQVTAQVGLLGGDSLLKEPPSSSVSSSPENTVCEDDTICKTFGKYSCWEDCVLGCGSTLRSWVPRYSTRIFWDCKCYCSALGANGDTCYDSKDCE